MVSVASLNDFNLSVMAPCKHLVHFEKHVYKLPFVNNDILGLNWKSLNAWKSNQTWKSFLLNNASFINLDKWYSAYIA